MSETIPYTGNAIHKSSLDDLTYQVGMENIYTFCTHAYYGTGGFADGSFLEKFSKETTINRRARLVYYKNYIKGIIDSLLTSVFNEEAMRLTNNVMFQEFLKNVDVKGNNIQQFTHTVLKYTRIHGVCFTVMDNVSDVPDLEYEAILNRAFPYIYYMTADQVHKYDTDEYGRLEEISFIDGYEIINDKKFTVYREWNSEYSARYIVKDGKEVYIEEPVLHNLGILPVIGTYLSMDNEVLPFPPIHDLARLSLTIYNQDSEQRNLERLCATPTFCIQTKNTDLNVNIGADSLLAYGGEYEGSVTAPAWISPSQDILTVMGQRSEKNVQSLIEQANVIGATAINKNSSYSSGVSMSYQFIGQNAALKQTARIAENFENMIALMFGLYTNQTIDYSVVYRENYKPTGEEISKKMETLSMLLDLDMSEMVNTEIKKEMIKDIADFYGFEVDGQVLAQSIASQVLI